VRWTQERHRIRNCRSFRKLPHSSLPARKSADGKSEHDDDAGSRTSARKPKRSTLLERRLPGHRPPERKLPERKAPHSKTLARRIADGRTVRDDDARGRPSGSRTPAHKPPERKPLERKLRERSNRLQLHEFGCPQGLVPAPRRKSRCPKDTFDSF
jgi:hypothetical protein